MSNIAKSFVELIGKTPLLAATRFGKKYGADANIFAKLEYFSLPIVILLAQGNIGRGILRSLGRPT